VQPFSDNRAEANKCCLPLSIRVCFRPGVERGWRYGQIAGEWRSGLTDRTYFTGPTSPDLPGKTAYSTSAPRPCAINGT